MLKQGDIAPGFELPTSEWVRSAGLPPTGGVKLQVIKATGDCSLRLFFSLEMHSAIQAPPRLCGLAYKSK